GVRVAAVGRAGVAIVAPAGARSARPVGHVLAAVERVAGVLCAGVAVIAVERRARLAGPSRAGFVSVADVAVAARRPVLYRGVLAARRRVARVDGAGIAVVTVGRRRDRVALAVGAAGFHAVADVVVGARVVLVCRIARTRVLVLAARHRVAAVGRARVAVIAV